MPPFTHRAPGVFGAAFDAKHVMPELICDGIHIDASAVRVVFSLFGAERMILISDSMMATGMEDGAYSLGGLPVTVRGNLATLEDGTIGRLGDESHGLHAKGCLHGNPVRDSRARCNL